MALKNCKTLADVNDEAQWLTDFRCAILMDHIDIWLSMLAPWKLRKQIIQRDEFPESGAFVLVCMHWNTGFSAFHRMHVNGRQVVYLQRKRERANFPGKYMEYLYVKLRRRHLEKLFPNMRYAPGGYPRKVIKALQTDGAVLAAVDVAAMKATEQHKQVYLYGKPVMLSSGMGELMTKFQSRAVFFRVVIDPKSGYRTLELDNRGAYQDCEQLYADIQAWMQNNLDESSAAWFMWPWAAQFFTHLRAPPRH